MKNGFIYGLRCPLSGEIRYIGQTTITLKRRLTQHKCDKRHNPYKINWINKLDELKLLDKLKIEFIEECIFEFLNEREIFWINFYKEKGNNLVNLTDGGDGMKGYPCSAETRLKLSKIHKGRKISDKTKEKISKAHKGKILSNEHKNLISEGLLIAYQEGRKKTIITDEQKIKISKGLKKHFYDNPKPKKEKIKKEKHPHIYTDEEILKSRERTLGEKNPFYGKKHSDETKKIIGDKNREHMTGEKNHFYGKTHSDETKEKISNTLKEKPKKIYYIYDDEKLIKQDTSLKLLDFFNLRRTDSICRFCDKNKKYKGYYISSFKINE